MALGAPAPDFRKLLIRELKITPVLRFHELDGVRDVGLPFRRPTQYLIEDFLHLVFCHNAIIADRLSLATARHYRKLAL